MNKIVSIKIHPAIGIARVGNSEDEFFIGPELPGVQNPPAGGYKDSHLRVKRQAARFRLFGYDVNGKVVQEITANEAEIKWTAHLANKKAAWKKFDGLKTNTSLRNTHEKNRAALIIDLGERTLNQINTNVQFDSGYFGSEKVPLGEMRMDDDGRLLILGGKGHSASPPGKPLTEFANNDHWYDDISDGPITAKVKLKGSTKTWEASPTWVICAPPDFAPPINNVISLYDTLLQVAIDKLGYTLPAIPSFKKDLFPLLTRANNIKWVSMMMWKMHGGHGSKPKTMESKHKSMEEGMPLIVNDSLRKKVFEKLTNPYNPFADGDNDMPILWSDYYLDQKKKNGEFRNETLCKWQYDYLKKWSEGNFIHDWIAHPDPAQFTIPKITPMGLDQAALENCSGGPLYPGIEASWMLRDH